jgi:hypothetical protein
VEVDAGIKAGNQVIRTPQISLVDGSKVQVYRGRCTRRIILPVTMKMESSPECSGPTARENY